MKKTLIAGFTACTLVFAACSADKTDFKAAAEKTIKDEIAKQIDGDASAKCDNPDSTKVGTTFDCVGTAGDGSTSLWSAEITSEKVVTVNFVGIGDPAEETEGT